MPTQTSRPKLVAPPGTCDTHMHFYNAKFPTAPTALSTPPDAWTDDYEKVQERLGLQRVVVVQPTTYGRDNACQLEAMAHFGANARGVLVADTDTTDAELERLTGLGARGIRFHMLPGGALPWEMLEEMAARVHAFGWHVQLQMNGRDLPEREAMLKRLPGTLVVDHVGRFMDPVPVDDAAFKVLLGLLEGGRCWVKLSAPYESSVSGPPRFEDVAIEARALVKAAPERMLWASNWPHPGKDPQPDDALMLDLLSDWVDDDATRARILVDNPAELYGF
jgi:D-galactarolactone isomerase